MKRIFATVLMLVSFVVSIDKASAQQDAQYTQYMYNTQSINPAYAGSRDVLSVLGLYRSQWIGLEGAPTTGTFSIHSPIGNRVSLGLNIVRDEIFISDETYVDLDFSYTLKVSEKANLALGLKVGGHLLDVNSNRANTGSFQPNDPNAEIFIDNKFSPQFGAGAYYYTDTFYFGLSVPNILETKHFDESNNSNESSSIAKERINSYLITGFVFDLSNDIKFKPSLLTKVVEGAPLQVDLSANFLFYDKLTIGAAYRWSAALSSTVAFQVSDQVLIGFAYDRETTELQQYNDGSYEVFLRFELFNNTDRFISPRFF